MKTSSIGLAAAVVLLVASLNSAMAGGWMVPGRPSFFPPTHMFAPPVRVGPPVPGGFHREFGPNGPFFPFGPPGLNGVHHEFGPGAAFFPFGPFGPNGFRHEFGPGAGFFSAGYFGAANPNPVSAGEPLARAVIWAPINVTTVEPASRCGYGYRQHASFGGPKIITIGAPPPSASDEKMPTVIYGTQGLPSC
jgi:hypothetical protein